MRTKKLLLTLGFLFTVLNAFGQGRYLQMVKKSNGKIRIFNENKRVKIKTFSKQKFIGRFTIIDERTLAIKGTELRLEDIRYVRNRSLGSAFASAGIAGYGGLFSLALIASLGIDSDTAPSFALLSGVLVTSGIFAQEIFPKNPKSKWDYSIVISP